MNKDLYFPFPFTGEQTENLKIREKEKVTGECEDGASGFELERETIAEWDLREGAKLTLASQVVGE